MREAQDMHTQIPIFSSVAEHPVRYIARPCHNTWNILMLAFLVIFWKACHQRWSLCFYWLSLAKDAYASYFNEYGSTCIAQSYHIHEVESMSFEPNAPPDMRQEGGRPRHAPQQEEDSKRVVDRMMIWLSQRAGQQDEIGRERKILKDRSRINFLIFLTSLSFSFLSCLFLLLPFPSPSSSPSFVHSSWSRWEALVVTGQWDFL